MNGHKDEIDELELVPEALKDLTTSFVQAEGVRGGPTTPGHNCECGTA